ncbi:hypothetical protein LXL04_000047 [Taraxacum kok-saghyz]
MFGKPIAVLCLLYYGDCSKQTIWSKSFTRGTIPAKNCPHTISKGYQKSRIMYTSALLTWKRHFRLSFSSQLEHSNTLELDDGIGLKELILGHTHAKPPIPKQVTVTMFSSVGRIAITIKLKNKGIAYGICDQNNLAPTVGPWCSKL